MVSLEASGRLSGQHDLAVLDRAALDANYGAGTAKRVTNSSCQTASIPPSMAFPRADRSLGARRLC